MEKKKYFIIYSSSASSSYPAYLKYSRWIWRFFAPQYGISHLNTIWRYTPATHNHQIKGAVSDIKIKTFL